MGPPKVMKNSSEGDGLQATTLLGSATLPFVISTEAKRSGEISVLTTSPGRCFSTERSEVEGPAVSLRVLTHPL
jgi:hypothetical protein